MGRQMPATWGKMIYVWRHDILAIRLSMPATAPASALLSLPLTSCIACIAAHGEKLQRAKKRAATTRTGVYWPPRKIVKAIHIFVEHAAAIYAYISIEKVWWDYYYSTLHARFSAPTAFRPYTLLEWPIYARRGRYIFITASITADIAALFFDDERFTAPILMLSWWYDIILAGFCFTCSLHALYRGSGACHSSETCIYITHMMRAQEHTMLFIYALMLAWPTT